MPKKKETNYTVIMEKIDDYCKGSMFRKWLFIRCLFDDYNGYEILDSDGDVWTCNDIVYDVVFSPDRLKKAFDRCVKEEFESGPLSKEAYAAMEGRR